MWCHDFSSYVLKKINKVSLNFALLNHLLFSPTQTISSFVFDNIAKRWLTLRMKLELLTSTIPLKKLYILSATTFLLSSFFRSR